MAGSVLSIVAGYTLVKSVRDAVFLTKFGMRELALVSIGLALFAGLFTGLVHKVSKGLSRHRLILVTHGVVAASLLAFWPALVSHLPGAATALYVWSSFFGLFLLANFWLLANQLYDARSAKRLFAILASGAILGGVVGGELGHFLAPRIGALNLLPVIAGLLVLSATLAELAWRHHKARAGTALPRDEGKNKEAPAEPKFLDGFRKVKESPYLLLIASMLLLSTLATTLLDYQVKAVVKAFFGADRDGMTAFFSRLQTLLSVASFGVQVLITSRLLRRFGVATALFLLPLAIFLGAGGIAMHVGLGISALFAAKLAKVGDGGVRFSIDKSAMELLYMPVPTRVKAQAKPVIDTFVDRLATGLTALTWLAITAIGHGQGPVVLAAFVTMGLVGLWSVVIMLVRRRYLRAFREALPGPTEDGDPLLHDLDDEQQVVAVRRALASGDPTTVLLGLDALHRAHRKPLMPELRPLVEHPWPEVRARAYDLLAACGDRSATVVAQRCIVDPSPAVRAAAVRYLALMTEHAADAFCTHPDPRVRVPALAHLATHSARDAARVSGHLQEILDGPHAAAADVRVEVARAIGALPLDEARQHLRLLLFDTNPAVAFAAGASAARVGDVSWVRDLLATFAVPERRPAARAALAGYGRMIIRDLAAALKDRALPGAARRAIPNLLGRTGRPEAAQALLAAMPGLPTGTRTRVVRALWTLRRDAKVTLDEGAVLRRVLEEAKLYAEHVAALADEAVQDKSRSAGLLRRALEDACREDLERVFRMLGLVYPERDSLSIYYGLLSPEPPVRANALELLDNVLDKPMKRHLLPLLERAREGLANNASRTKPVVVDATRHKLPALLRLAADPEPWLRACAVLLIGERRDHSLRGAVFGALTDPDPNVRDAATLAAARIDTRTAAEGGLHEHN